MIIGIGCDIVEHSTTEKLEWTSDIILQKNYFSQKEIDLYNAQNKISFLCGRFAIKEAVLKCLKTGMQDGLSLTDIQTIKSENGQPILKLSGEVKKISDKLGINSWHISISHSEHFSTAYVIAEKLN